MSDYLSPKQKAILKRSQSSETASNYSDAVDQNTWIGTIDNVGLGGAGDIAVQAADYISNFLFGKKKIPTAQSNCTLTASQWVNPKVPISRAETIINDGSKYGYVEIPEAHLLPGDLAIATNPSDNAHHTMLVHGFTKGQQNHTFQGKNYILPPDHPLVRYSNGTTHPSGYRRSVGLMEYLDNSEGKTNVRYFRHYTPDQKEVLLPEIVVTPQGNYIPKGQKTIRINQNGGTLSRERKIDVLKHIYNKEDILSDKEYVNPWFETTNFDNYTNEGIDDAYDYYINNPHYIYSPLGEGVTVVGYRPLKLRTWYPMVHAWYDSKKDKNFKWTGHSAITGGAFGTKTSSDYDYNLVTNNCSNETKRMLETVFNKEADISGFTTPGDVRDFAIDNGGVKKDNQGRLVVIPMDKDRYDRLQEYISERNKKKVEYYRNKRNKNK